MIYIYRGGVWIGEAATYRGPWAPFECTLQVPFRGTLRLSSQIHTYCRGLHARRSET